jgi:cytochrome P450
MIHSYRGNFIKGEMYGRIVTPDMENVFTTTDTVFHSSHRRLLSAPLSESSLKQFEKVVTARIQLAVQKIGEESKKCGAADVLKWWLFMATDIIGELSFGDSFRMLELGKVFQLHTSYPRAAI